MPDISKEEWPIGEMRNGQVMMADPTSEQIAEWQEVARDTNKRLLAGEFDYPNPLLDRIKALEDRLAAIEQFLVI